jgi:hypothetical protein
MNRYTFVVHVHPDGPSTLENLSTREQVPISDLAAVGLQIEQWLAAPDGDDEHGRTNGHGSGPRRETGGEHAEADQ